MLRNWQYKRSLMHYHLKQGGLTGLLDLLATYLIFWRHRRLIGNFIERRGNIIHIDGAQFSLDTPLLSTQRKALFLGQHEIYERIAIKDHLDPACPVIELGAGIGVISCLVNRMLNHPDQHVVMEPNTELIPLLDENRRLNNCQFSIVNAALAYGSEFVDLYQRPSILTATTLESTDRKISVPAMTLQRVLDQFNLDHVTLICDIEGAEVELISEEQEILINHIQMVIMELHPSEVGASAFQKMLAQLTQSGFEKIDETHPTPNGNIVSVFRNGR